MANLGFSFEGNWAKQDYDDVTYGRTTAERQGYFLSGNWGDASKLLLTRLRQLGGNEVPVRPPLHRHGRRRTESAVGLLHGSQPGLLQPVRATWPEFGGSYNWNSADQGHRRT